jgi:hypothetical protein
MPELTKTEDRLEVSEGKAQTSGFAIRQVGNDRWDTELTEHW